MKEQTQPTNEDDFWTHDTHLFDGVFRYYSRDKSTPRPVRGKIHVSDEHYSLSSSEIIEIPTKRGKRSYVMMHPYVFEPDIILSVGLYKQPKRYADQKEAIGEVIGSKQESVRERQVGNAQAWYYQEDKVLVLWECFLWEFVRDLPLLEDPNMRQLWQGFEQWLIGQFPQAARIVTPFNDPIADSPKEYQDFLRTLGYESVAKAAFGKPIRK